MYPGPTKFGIDAFEAVGSVYGEYFEKFYVDAVGSTTRLTMTDDTRREGN